LPVTVVWFKYFMKRVLHQVSILSMAIVMWQRCVYETLPAPVGCDAYPVMIQLISVIDAHCNLKDGSFQISVSGGTGPYRYTLGDGNFQNDPVFSGLASGNYTVVALDINNCQDTREVIVRNLDGVNIELSTTEAGCKTSNGSISIMAANGTRPYLFKLNGGDFQPDNSFNNLLAGEYTIVVKDAAGCQASQTIRIRSGISFAANISPIIQNNCAINGCHNGSQFPDFRVFKNIQDNAGRIKTQTSSRSMPIGRVLTQTQIEQIACWVDDGALQN
jgi:hypothetical protein